MESVTELDWSKLQLAEKDLNIANAELKAAQANVKSAQLQLDLLKREIVMVYNIGPNDKVNQDRSIHRAKIQEVEQEPTENKLA